jgi:hypothetical protein
MNPNGETRDVDMAGWARTERRSSACSVSDTSEGDVWGDVAGREEHRDEASTYLLSLPRWLPV